MSKRFVVVNNPRPEKRLAGQFAIFLEDVFARHREGPQRVRSVMTLPGRGKNADDRELLICLDAEPTQEQVDALVAHLKRWKAPR